LGGADRRSQREDPAPAGPQARLSLSQAFETLASPYALERCSVLQAAQALVVDVEEAAAGKAAAFDVAAFGRALAQLPCPTVAVCRAPLRADAALLEHFDVVVREQEELGCVLEAVARRPLAALALVQLLRLGASLDLHQALVAESLVYSTLQSGPEFAAWRVGREKPSRPEPTSDPAVRIERWGDQLVLSLNRPARHNAFSVEMRDALVEGLQMAVADDSLREIVLRGEGPSFSSGGDLAEFGDLPDPATAHAVRSTRNPARLLAACGDRVTARVHGACVGAGAELPAFARRVVAARDTFFQLPELAMGLVPGAGGTASLPRRIGRQRTAWLALSGERLDAETAQRWGLVDELVDELGGETAEIDP
jgi:enoyl-CoA hydratase/carnithine racemase